MRVETPLQFETVGADGDLTVRRALGSDGATVFLIAIATEETPSAGTIARFQRNVETSRALVGDCFTRGLEVMQHEGRLALRMEAGSGEGLGALLQEGVSLPVALRVGIGLARALAQLHVQGFIHRALKPAYVTVDRVSGEAWLGGFGMTLRLPRQRERPTASGVIIGTPAYMAPEQSGWMNRSTDARSDLYSFGVILYQLLTRELPFAARTLGEWIHCHVARQPVAPYEKNADIPRAVSDVVMRLLAKNPEERYQTAAGVQVDLERCLHELESTATVELFAVGSSDVSERLVLPEKLYGRSVETRVLLDAQARAATSGAPELVLVSGYSGVGKSSLVGELRQGLVASRGRFASAKFDLARRDVPYSAIASVLKELVGALLHESASVLAGWRQRILEAVGPNGQLVIDLVPELALVIGPQLPVEVGAQDAAFVVQLTLRRFLGVFAGKESPLVVFLDDLQWLDAATLAFLEQLVATDDLHHVLLVLAYRDNEVDIEHPLWHRLPKLRGAWGGAREIVLASLAESDIAELLGDALGCAATTARPLAAVVTAKTDGNPFFALQFLSLLHDVGQLRFDPVQRCWSWALEAIQASSYTDNVVELMTGKIMRLRDTTRSVLRDLACFGGAADLATLSTLADQPEGPVEEALLDGARAGLLQISERGTYAFAHDRIQEAAYRLVPEAERPVAHLRLGRLLRARSAGDVHTDDSFEIVNQLNRGSALMTDATERADLAELNVRAGERALAAAAQGSALVYFRAAEALLDESAWSTRPELAFTARLRHAESEILTGAQEDAERRLDALAGRARNLQDHAQITFLLMMGFNSLGDHARSISVGLAFLRRVGIDWSAAPSEADVVAEIEQVWARVGDRPITSFASLPPMTDLDQIATMDVMCGTFAPALFTNEQLYVLLLARMVNLSLQHGNCDASALAYAMFGSVTNSLGKYELGRELGELGLALVEEKGLTRFRARVYVALGHLMPFTRPLASIEPMGRKAFLTGLESGDLTFATYGLCEATMSTLATFVPLEQAAERISEGARFCETLVPVMEVCILDQLNLVRALQGQPAALPAGFADEEAVERHFDADPALWVGAFWRHVRKLQRHVFLGDTTRAMHYVGLLADRPVATSIYVELVDYHFHGAVARGRHFDESAGEARLEDLSVVRAHHDYLCQRAVLQPANFEHRALAVGAELARLEERFWEAQGLYEAALAAASRNGFVHDEALISELAAAFHRRRGFATSATAYERNARTCYTRWGAVEKVRRLDGDVPSPDVPPRAVSTFETPLEQLDLDTVIEVSHAVSREIVLANVVRALLTIAVRHAGAERAVLVMLPEDEGASDLQLVAEATTNVDDIVVRRISGGVDDAEVPASALRFVMRTRETLVVGDASTDSSLSTDVYVERSGVRSLICVPLLKQGRALGLLYLENRLLAGVFTPARISVLAVIASQASISLENARLYERLEHALESLAQSETELRRTLDCIPAIVWFNAPDGGNEFQSSVWRDYTGQSAAETAGDGWTRVIHPDDLPTIAGTWRDLLASGTAGEAAARVRRRDGVYRWLLFRTKPYRDESGHTLKWYGITTDIDDARQAEAALAGLQVRLAEVARVAMAGELTASIAHEVNQPIAAILVNVASAVRWLDRTAPDVNEARQSLQRIQRDGERMTGIVRRVRALFANEARERRTLAINDLVLEIVALTRQEIALNGVQVHTKLDADLPTVIGDSVQIQQVLMNLVSNATQAMSTITDRPREISITTERAGEGVRVIVDDTGAGLNPDTVPRIFEAFHTTKPAGMGLGLAISRSIVEDHGGTLGAEARPGVGARFFFTLGDSQAEDASASAAAQL